ncbi:Z804B protein, partial [Centropus bengalensis]|nr:Z804B protein [Centropus bengalensis]
DYAEKEKAAAKALEDVKANFYCELCDKQYHKHQEFDNHINSYDHAHKQRLKDLKQREFARNVASKSWKDEKKQEKALKRLHQLAELRKQSEWQVIMGSGPLLKAPRLVTEKQQSEDGIFLYKDKFTASSQRNAMSEVQGSSSTVLEKQQLVIRRHQSPTERPHVPRKQVSQLFPESTNVPQRAGVSFSFSKKVPLKLESSASVFSENSEEGNDCTESPNLKKKQALEGCCSSTLLEEDMKASLDKGPSITQDQMDLDNSTSSHVATKPQILKENNKINDRELEEKFSGHPTFSKVKIQLSNLDFSGSPRETEQERKLNETEQLLETFMSPSCQASKFCTQTNTHKHSNAHLPELQQQPKPQLACTSNINDSPRVVKGERSLENSEITSGNMETLPRETMVKEVKSQTLPFLHVVSKDGTTALQWPTELLLFTKTEPCISYGCNPLYFDFRLSLNHRDGKQHETNKASCKEHSINKNAEENEASGLIKHKQMSNEQDNQLLKPKKMKVCLNPRKAKQKADSDIGKEINENGQKYNADYLNENIPKVPAHLDVSRKEYVTEKVLHTKLRKPLKHHFHSCERKKYNIRNESISFSAFMSRIKKSRAAKYHVIYSEEKCENQNDCRSIQDVTSCSSDISDSGKDSSGSFLSYKTRSSSSYSENDGCGRYTRCWRFLSPQKSSFDRHSSYSDTSASSTSSYVSYMSPTSNNHSRNHLLFCCKRKGKAAEGHKCKHRKHKCIFTSDNTDKNYLHHSKSHRTRNCTQRGTIKYKRCSRHKDFQHRDRSKQSRHRHWHFNKEHRSRSYHSSRSCSTRDSRSSERSCSSRLSRCSSSGSFSKEINCDNKTKEDTKRGSKTKSQNDETAHYDSLNVNGQSKTIATCPSESLAKNICGKRKSLTAKLLLERVQSKKTQEKMHSLERFTNTCGVELKDHSQSHFALQFSSSVDDSAMLPLPEKLLSIGKNDMGHNEINLLETSVKKNNFEASEITSVALSTGTDYDHCLFKDIIQIGTGYQYPNIKRNTAIKEQSNLFISEVQPFIQSCDSVPNDFPGAFPTNRYSVVANSTETKEELHGVNMDSNWTEGSSDSICDNAMQNYVATVNDPEVYSKSISPPLTQQPITFSPEEVDKYRLLQLQAQQHMQKQLLAKHLKVLPAPGPAAFSATPAVPALPAQQHATVTTIHHTLLQHFAVSASVHPHGSHLSLAHLHPLTQTHFAPISLSPLAPALIPTHPALLTGHPLHLVSTTPLHPSPLTFPTLPHTAYIPALFAPHLNAATPSAIHPNPLVHPLFQGQEPYHHSCSSPTQQFPTIKEVFSVSSYLN